MKIVFSCCTLHQNTYLSMYEIINKKKLLSNSGNFCCIIHSDKYLNILLITLIRRYQNQKNKTFKYLSKYFICVLWLFKL